MIKHSLAIAVSSIALLSTLVLGQANDSVTTGSDPEAATENVQWLSGADAGLTFHIHGTFVDSDGKPVQNIAAFARKSYVGNRKEDIDVAVEGNQFRFDLPGGNLWGVRIFARIETGDQHACLFVRGEQIRQAARDGIVLQLKPAERRIAIRVVDGELPVPDAEVKLEFESGYECVGRSDENGIAMIRCLSDLKLDHITAWKDDQRLGGYGFGRKPVRDNTLDEYTVQLAPARTQKICLVDESDDPVADVRFRLLVSTPAPDYNFLETSPHGTVTSDENGEAIVDWFPDWEGVNYYAELLTDDWIVKENQNTLIDGVIKFTLQKTKKDDRRRVTGRVRFAEDLAAEFPGGFLIEARSHQGEVENHIDHLNASSNVDGRFSFDVLPGATYCFYLNDAEWTSKSGDLMMFDSSTGVAAEPVVEPDKGYEVTIVASQGSDKKPMADQPIHLRSEHRFSWVENGQKRDGISGRGWYVYTDENGRSTARVMDGNLVASIYSPDWRFENTFEVKIGQTNEFAIHRPIGTAITVTGKLIPAAGVQSDLAGTEITIASMDGQTSGQQMVVADAEGNFQFETKSTLVGIYAYAKHGNASAAKVVESSAPNVELKMMPTGSYHGRLLGDNDFPLPDHLVRAKIQLELPWNSDLPFPRQLDGNVLQSVTDANGYYALEGVPFGVRFSLSAKSADGPAEDRAIGERFMEVGEERPVDIHRFSTGTTAKPRTLGDSLTGNLRDCKLYGIHSLVVLLSDEASTAFAHEVVLDYDDDCPAVTSFLPLLVTMSGSPENPEKKRILGEREWLAPESGHLTLCALDGLGKELDRVEITSTDPNAIGLVNEFLQKNEPPKQDAHEKLAKALEEAKSSGRRVWAQHSQTRCAPCYRLSRWIDDHRAVLEKDFVFIKVDNVRDEGGIEVTRKITGGRNFGIPFVAIMDSEGEILIDSESPLGNFGFPTTFEDTQHLRKMILAGGTHLTARELDELTGSLLKNN